tara:strand:+ start:611 stop:1735 length:1125 start_codon:yes stop_codon:yes gene_type:complete
MDLYWEQFKTPFLCFAGYSGVGKTTLITRLIKKFHTEGLRIGYYKHDSHRFQMDKEGKDTWHCARAGSEIVTINDPMHFAVIGGERFKKITISRSLEQCDCILIEGYKQSPFDKIVFLDHEGKLPIPAASAGIKAIVHQGSLTGLGEERHGIKLFHRDEVDSIYHFVKSHFRNCVSPLQGAVFVGGHSKRMGRPKFALAYNGSTETLRISGILESLCEKVFLSSRSDLDMGELGDFGRLQRVDDEHIGLGPVGGLATLMSRYPDSAWLVSACDMPFIEQENFELLVNQRDPLKYGTCFMKKRRLGFEPMCAIYEPKFIFPLFEAMSRRELSLSRIIDDLQFKCIPVPEAGRDNFTNVNNPQEYEAARLRRESGF